MPHDTLSLKVQAFMLLSTGLDQKCSSRPGSSNARCADPSTRTRRASRLIQRTSCLHKYTRNQVNPNSIAPKATKAQKNHEDGDETAHHLSPSAWNLRPQH